jgi:hypothetical protein
LTSFIIFILHETLSATWENEGVKSGTFGVHGRNEQCIQNENKRAWKKNIKFEILAYVGGHC